MGARANFFRHYIQQSAEIASRNEGNHPPRRTNAATAISPIAQPRKTQIRKYGLSHKIDRASLKLEVRENVHSQTSRILVVLLGELINNWQPFDVRVRRTSQGLRCVVSLSVESGRVV